MGAETAIAWCDSTFNPWWGCTKVSPGCEHCYAETFDKRVGGDHWGPLKPRRVFGDKHWAEPLKWNAAAARDGVRRRVFSGSMCDVFDTEPPAGQRDRLWETIRATPRLDWLLLTKRPHNIRESLPADWGLGWPNVWLGTTVEGPGQRDRLGYLRVQPARVRFVSAEPLIETWSADLRGIDWVIVGGESGPKARPMGVEWARALQADAVLAGAAFFAKQLGGHPDKRDRLEDWPEDLRIREFPEVKR